MGSRRQTWPYGNESPGSGLIGEILPQPLWCENLNRRLIEADQVWSVGKRSPKRIAILSLLFNWPSTGGGIVHTAELAHFLTQDGYEVCHFFAVYEPWSIGVIREVLPYNACAVRFDQFSWTRDGIHSAFRQTVDSFHPDAVILTDSWNSKGLLASAVSDYPYFIRLAAMECICPLNNVRLLADRDNGIRQCRKSQLSTRDACVTCVRENAHSSGSLHADERELVGFNETSFNTELQMAFANAAGILVVNPLIGALCEPYAKQVHVIPSGFDPRRFDNLPERRFGDGGIRILFAGLVNELMKGFHVLFEACCQLWAVRQDFELHVTAEPDQYEAPFLRYRGWKNQQELPSLMAECDIIVVPTIAQEALGRTAVEAMGASRPVVASRIGGLPFTVIEGVTGLLADPGNATELGDRILSLMNNPDDAIALGIAGRKRFLAEHTWQHVIASKYRPLFATVRSPS
jgi:glycosyltransferase involved in cell wall biosynthesis